MYALLCRYLPAWAAELGCVVWYAALILAIGYFAFEPQAEFRYATL